MDDSGTDDGGTAGIGTTDGGMADTGMGDSGTTNGGTDDGGTTNGGTDDGGTDDTETDDTETDGSGLLPDMAAELTLTPEVTKIFALRWTDVPDATHYELWEDPDGAAGPQSASLVEGDIAPGTEEVRHIVPIFARLGAEYTLQSCIDAACVESEPVSPAEGLAAAVGYFKASASTTRDFDLFGTSVALSADGTTLAVGAFREDSDSDVIDEGMDDESADDAGAVYVFARSPDGTWGFQAYLKAPNSDRIDQFGRVVTLSADGMTLAVGATAESSDSDVIDEGMDNNDAFVAGAAYVFTRSPEDTWSHQAYIKAPNSGPGDNFGSSIALSADGATLAVGANAESSDSDVIDEGMDDNSADGAGAAYVFIRSPADGAWSFESYLKAPNSEGNDRFGWSIAMSADGATIAVGAALEDSDSDVIDAGLDNNEADGAGAVYVFARAAGGAWTHQAYLKAPNSDGLNPDFFFGGDAFGHSVALSADGTSLAVGAPGESSGSNIIDEGLDDNAMTGAGAVYVFTRVEGAWGHQTYLKAPNPDGIAPDDPFGLGGDEFGNSVALSADGATLAIGAQGEASASNIIGEGMDDNSDEWAGAVYTFTQSAEGTWNSQAYLKIPNASGGFGDSVALSADGTTLASGAVGDSGSGTHVNPPYDELGDGAEGAVYLF